MTRLVLYAPNVNTGGGLTLLKALLAISKTMAGGRCFLDARARSRLPLPAVASVTWVKPTPLDRLLAEYRLARECRPGDTVLCFHGLPPLMPNRGRVVVFQQNRNYLGLNRLNEFAPRTRVRLTMERLVARLFRFRVSTYFVQTPSMRRELLAWHGGAADVRISPFVGPTYDNVANEGPPSALRWDFLYVADGVAHKNHRRLLEAWRLLAADGLRPILALTLSARDGVLLNEIADAAQRDGLRIENLGEIPHSEVFRAYRQAKALLFPSTSESFGLPLIEAQQSGLPIVASERDFVRDVCTPVQTFDPDSAVSIARAVRRFLGKEEGTITLQSPRQFLEDVLTSG